jgi:hypothetical protein
VNNDFLKRKMAVSNLATTTERERINSFLPTDTAVEGTFLVDGSGEALKIVNFPIRFIGRPIFTTGGELHLDTNPVPGQFPTISCVINRWSTEQHAGFSKMYFIGAELLVVTTGPSNQRLWVHWRASGRGIVNPAVEHSLTSDSVI